MLAPMATVTASTKRAPRVAGTSSAFVTHLARVKCLPLMPVDAETRNRPELQTFMSLHETFVDSDADIIAGDKLVIAGTDLPIRAVEVWPWESTSYLRVIVERLER